MSKSTTRTIIIGLILMTLAVGAFGLIVYQVLAQGEKLAVQISTLETERGQEANYLRLQRLAAATVSEREQLLFYFLEGESSSIDFLNQVESLAPEMNVGLTTSGLDSIVDKEDNATWIEASFSFSGTRTEVERFIQLLENVPYLSRVTSIDMSAFSSNEWRANVTMQIKVLDSDHVK